MSLELGLVKFWKLIMRNHLVLEDDALPFSWCVIFPLEISGEIVWNKLDSPFNIFNIRMKEKQNGFLVNINYYTCDESLQTIKHSPAARN